MRVASVVPFILAMASATSAAAVGRLIVGHETSISQYPYMASILHSFDGSFFIPDCAGAIINANTVVTAATCWSSSFNSIRIRVGSSFTTSGGQVLTVNSVGLPLSFNPVTLEMNIARLRTTEDIILTPNVAMPVQFATFNTVVPDHSLVTIAGWGRTEVGQYSEQLRAAQFRTMNNTVCAAHSSPDVFVPNTIICTYGVGSPSPDVCVGDIGSPVVLNNVIVGLVSNPQCGNGRPSYHTRMSVASWILT